MSTPKPNPAVRAKIVADLQLRAYRPSIRRAKHPGTCSWCAVPFESGAEIAWTRDHGAVHVDCLVDVVMAAAPAKATPPKTEARP